MSDIYDSLKKLFFKILNCTNDYINTTDFGHFKTLLRKARMLIFTPQTSSCDKQTFQIITKWSSYSNSITMYVS